MHWKTKKERASLKLTASAIFDIQSIDDKLIVGSGEGMVTIVNLKNLSIVKQVKASERSARTIASLKRLLLKGSLSLLSKGCVIQTLSAGAGPPKSSHRWVLLQANMSCYRSRTMM